MIPAFLRSAPLAALAMLALSGCIIVHDHDRRHDDFDYEYDDDWDDDRDDDALDDPALVRIDVGEEVPPVEAGQGAGVFVETDANGHWRIYTACDTDVSGYACRYDLYVQAQGLTIDAGEDLEAEDDFEAFEDEVDLYFETSFDFDGITLHASPGEALTLTMYLDGASQPELVYWVGDGIVNTGAPTNPVAFDPSSPDDA